MQKAMQGEPRAMFSMGEYLAGSIWLGDKIAKPDMVAAAGWYIRAARAGHVEAKERLAQYHSVTGHLFPNDELCTHIKDVAAAKPDETQWAVNLAQMYRLGNSCPKDWQQAEKWYRYAKIHNKEALPRNVYQHWADIYLQGGHGIEKNPAMATFIYNSGIKAGYIELYLEQYRIHLSNHDGIKAIKALQQYNIQHKKKTGRDDVNVYLYMADIHRYGRGNVGRSMQKAVTAYKKALRLQDMKMKKLTKKGKTPPSWHYKKAARIQTDIADAYMEFSDYGKANHAYLKAESRWEVCFKTGACDINRDSLINLSHNEYAACGPVMRKLPTSKYYYTRTRCRF